MLVDKLVQRAQLANCIQDTEKALIGARNVIRWLDGVSDMGVYFVIILFILCCVHINAVNAVLPLVAWLLLQELYFSGVLSSKFSGYIFRLCSVCFFFFFFFLYYFGV